MLTPQAYCQKELCECGQNKEREGVKEKWLPFLRASSKRSLQDPEKPKNLQGFSTQLHTYKTGLFTLLIHLVPKLPSGIWTVVIFSNQILHLPHINFSWTYPVEHSEIFLALSTGVKCNR